MKRRTAPASCSVDESAVVPAHWFLEVANVLVMANRRNRIGVDDVVRYAELLSELEFEVDPESPARLFGDVLQLAQTHRLTSYDAAYLELAIRRKLPLATLDLELRGAAESVGVNLLGM